MKVVFLESTKSFLDQCYNTSHTVCDITGKLLTSTETYVTNICGEVTIGQKIIKTTVAEYDGEEITTGCSTDKLLDSSIVRFASDDTDADVFESLEIDLPDGYGYRAIIKYVVSKKTYNILGDVTDSDIDSMLYVLR